MSEERISLRKIGYRCVCNHNLKTFVFMGMQSSVREVVIVSFATGACRSWERVGTLCVIEFA